MFKKFGIVIALTSHLATAEIYQWKDSAGNVHYSDSKPKDREELKPIDVIIPTAMPATKIEKRKEVTGPTVIELEHSNKQESYCNTKALGTTSKGWDVWEEKIWKDCHGMK